MGLLERDGRAKLTVIAGNTFKDMVRGNVDKNAVLVTDTHLAYQGLAYEYAEHLTINHSEGQQRRFSLCKFRRGALLMPQEPHIWYIS